MTPERCTEGHRRATPSGCPEEMESESGRISANQDNRHTNVELRPSLIGSDGRHAEDLGQGQACSVAERETEIAGLRVEQSRRESLFIVERADVRHQVVKI